MFQTPPSSSCCSQTKVAIVSREDLLAIWGGGSLFSSLSAAPLFPSASFCIDTGTMQAFSTQRSGPGELVPPGMAADTVGGFPGAACERGDGGSYTECCNILGTAGFSCAGGRSMPSLLARVPKKTLLF